MSSFSDENAGIPVSPRKLLSPIQAMGLVLKDSNRANISSFPDHSLSEKTNHDMKLDNSEDDDGVISFKVPSALSDGLELNPFHPRIQILNSQLTNIQQESDNLRDAAQDRNQREADLETQSGPVCSQDLRESAQDSNQCEADLETQSAPVCSQDLRESAQDSNQCKADPETQSAATCSEDPDMKRLSEKIELLSLNAINILDGEECGVSPCISENIACEENCQNSNAVESNTYSTGVALVCNSDALDHISTDGLKFDIDIPEDENPFCTRSQLANTPEKCALGLDENPFTTRSKLTIIPEKCAPGLVEDPLNARSQLENTLTKCALGPDENPSTTRCQLGKTLEKSATGLDENPFFTRSHLANTLGKCAPGLDENPSTTRCQLGKTPEKSATGLDENPFTTRTQLANTPEKYASALDEDPFNTRSQLANTPVNCALGLDENPSTARSQLGKTPEKSETGPDENPFTTKSHLANTPGKCAPGLDEDPFTSRSQIGKTPERSASGLDENLFTRNQLGKTLEKSAPELEGNFVAEKPNINADQMVADAQIICMEAINSQKKVADMLTDISDAVHASENKPAVKGDDLITSWPRNCTLGGEETDVLPEGELPAKTVLSSPTKEFEELASHEEMGPFKANKIFNSSAAVCTSDEVLNGYNPFMTRSNLTENSLKDKTKTKHEKSPIVALQPYEIGDLVAENDHEAEKRLSAQGAVGRKANTETTECHLEALQNTDPDGLKSEWKVFDVLGNGEEFTKALEENNPLLLASESELGIEENMFLPGTQVFNDPSAWELLEKFGGDAAKESDLRKQSLYIKFDPLVRPLTRSPEKMPAPAHAAPRKATGRHTEINTSLLNNSLAEESLCLFGTPPRVARRRSVLNQRRINASVSQTITEEEAVKQVDLFFMDGEEDSQQFINDQSQKRLSAVTNLVQVEEIPKFTESEWLRMQQTLKLQYEGQMLSKEREFTSALQEERAKVTNLQEKVQKFKSENKTLSDSVVSMKTVVAEYEKTLEILIATKEKTTEEARRKVEALQAEKDQALEDVQAWDKSFSQLHCRYEKMKTVLEGFKKNEEALKKTIKTLQDKLKESEDKTAKVKACAEDKIAEVAKILEQTKADNVRAEAELKRRQLQVQSLESTLEQKTKENKELTDLCETLINQVGGSKK